MIILLAKACYPNDCTVKQSFDHPIGERKRGKVDTETSAAKRYNRKCKVVQAESTQSCMVRLEFCYREVSDGSEPKYQARRAGRRIHSPHWTPSIDSSAMTSLQYRAHVKAVDGARKVGEARCRQGRRNQLAGLRPDALEPVLPAKCRRGLRYHSREQDINGQASIFYPGYNR